MAFCPHCGKTVTDQATKCIACSAEFEPRAKAVRKGTMMMNADMPPVTPPAAPVVPAAPRAVPAAAAAAVAALTPPTQGPSKVMKATMLGTGGAGFAPPRAPSSGGMPVVVPPPAAPPPAATKLDVALADTGRQPALEAPHEVAPSEERQLAQEAPRFLAGDPMAPPEAQVAMRAAEGRAPSRWQGKSPPPRTGFVLGVAIGGFLFICGLGYAAARYLGIAGF